MRKYLFLKVFCACLLMFFGVACTGLAAQWRTGYYSPIFPLGSGGMPASEVHYAAFTHIIHVSLIVSDSQGGIDNTTYGLTPAAIQDFVSRARAAGVSPILGLSQLAGLPNYLTQSINGGRLSTLVNNVMSYVNAYGYDGVDIDWEVDLDSNATNFRSLVNTLRAQLSDKLLLATFGGQTSIAAANAANLDQINLQCYDLASPRWGLVSHNSALYNPNGYRYPGGDPAYTVEWRMSAFVAAGVPPAKLGVGIPFYGYIWNGGTAPGQKGGTYSASSIDYRSLVTNPALWQDGYRQRDVAAGYVPYLSISPLNKFVTYEDAISIAAKWNYAKSGNFGGLMVFDLGSDWNKSGLTIAEKHPLAEALRIAAGVDQLAPE